MANGGTKLNELHIHFGEDGLRIFYLHLKLHRSG